MTSRNKFSPVSKLDKSHDVASFDCGKDSLNQHIHKYALTNQKAGSATTYVIREENSGVVVGFHSLAVSAVEHARTTERVQKGIARHPVPVMLLARLAVHKDFQRCGLGKALLKDALLRTAQVADIAGIRALLVHAKDEDARDWYEAFDLEPSPTNPFHLFLLMKDLRALL